MWNIIISHYHHVSIVWNTPPLQAGKRICSKCFFLNPCKKHKFHRFKYQDWINRLRTGTSTILDRHMDPHIRIILIGDLQIIIFCLQYRQMTYFFEFLLNFIFKLIFIFNKEIAGHEGVYVWDTPISYNQQGCHFYQLTIRDMELSNIDVEKCLRKKYANTQ